jgi:hypothetical protein
VSEGDRPPDRRRTQAVIRSRDQQSRSPGANAAWYLKRLLVLAAVAAAVTPWVLTALSLTRPLRIAQTPAMPRPQSIVWADRVFSSPAALAAWLSANGATYQSWARHHPADAGILEHVPPAAFTPPGQEAAGTSHRSKSSVAWARIGLLVVAALLMLVALIPEGLVELPGGGWLSATRRTYAFALGFALCLGVVIAGVQA